ncbi:OFA family MFS transporter [Umezawaea endophytica]|uniref:OFA family MFS transporter n=1 Tax=Umezawaea endophytica TaxID=1654476 RepID=A0A9X3A5S7_9PSEU|nr:OFA family MFS transporter [Umezawaea endophytica]MCS7484034.1 OFA family MFS transporter [Umezawaea endophytica]
MPEPQEMRDVYGRRYRVGESDRELLGRSRNWMLWSAWAAMFAAGIQQYGFGAVVPVLVERHRLTDVVWALALWTVCQAGTAFPAAWLRDRGHLPPALAVVVGGVLCGIGLTTLAHATSLVTIYLGYSLLGGVGAGLVYAACVGTVVRWFPERVTSGVGVVSGAFAYGCVPFVLLAGLVLNTGTKTLFLDAAAIVVLAVIVGAGIALEDPPKHWWPAHVEPRAWALDKARRRNQSAVRQYLPAEALRSGAVAPMFLAVALAAAVSLFDLAFLATFSGTDPLWAAVALSALAACTGGGRVLVGRISDRLGRRRTWYLSLLTGSAAQFLLLWAGTHDRPAALLLGACLAGLGTGCCYTLLVALVREYFGEESGLQNFGLLYSAKALGGVLGVGVAGAVVTTHGYPVAFIAAGLVGLTGALLTRALVQPGRSRLLPTS